MSYQKSSNPVLGKNIFEKANSQAGAYSEVMTINGAVNKTALLLLFVVLSAFYTWSKFFGAYSPELPNAGVSAVVPLMLIGGIGGFIMAIVTSFSPRKSAIFAPIYAALEGMFLGGLSAILEAQMPGLILRAVALTFAVFLGMLFVYRSGLIKVTDRFRRGVIGATIGVAIAYMISWIAGMFGASTGFMFQGGTMGIIISLVVVGIAAFNLLLDFDFIERGARGGAPKYMEWYAAFGLMVTLVWLYVEILRLLSRLNRN